MRHWLLLVGFIATIAFFWAWITDHYTIMALAFVIDCIAAVFAVRRPGAHPAAK